MSRLHRLETYRAGYIWDNYIVGTPRYPRLVLYLLQLNIYRTTLDEYIQGVIDGITLS